MRTSVRDQNALTRRFGKSGVLAHAYQEMRKALRALTGTGPFGATKDPSTSAACARDDGLGVPKKW